MAVSDKEFLGHGWAFPVTEGVDGDVESVAYEEDVHQAVRLIIGTDFFERVMRPTFGSGLRGLVFEPLTATTRALIKLRVEEALVQWEPRIDVVDVGVSVDNPANGTVFVEIQYRVRATNTFYNLVYPFYLLEGQEES